MSGIRERASELFDIPGDTLAGLLHIEITGTKELLIENHKGIAELSENEVIINAEKKSVTVRGQNMFVISMNSEELRIGGQIESIGFEG